MAWTEEQKEAARKELEKSRNSQASTASLLALLKASAWLVVGLFLLTIGFCMFQDHTVGWWMRGNGVALACLGLVGTVIASALTYVRFRDWRQSLAMERQRSLSS